MHPWHEISSGSNSPSQLNAIIEIQQGSKTKYELDKDTGHLRLDRVLFSGMNYPVNYGFVPQTIFDDGDPLDVVVMCSQPLMPTCLVEVTVVGSLVMIDNNERDDKIITVASHDPFLKDIKELNDIPQEALNTIIFFFENYKKAENKEVIIERSLTREETYPIIMRSIERYKEHFK